MRYLSILCIVLFAYTSAIARQNKTDSLSVELKIDKEYEVKRSAKQFSYDWNKGEYGIKTDSVLQQQYDARIIIKNNSDKPVYLWMMTCSWIENFEINNNYIGYDFFGCDGNFPIQEKINAGGSKIYSIPIKKSIKFRYPCDACVFGEQVEDTRVGLILVDDIFNPKLEGIEGYNLAMEDKSRWKIVWSNPVRLLTDEEVHPKPVHLTNHGYIR